MSAPADDSEAAALVLCSRGFAQESLTVGPVWSLAPTFRPSGFTSTAVHAMTRTYTLKALAELTQKAAHAAAQVT